MSETKKNVYGEDLRPAFVCNNISVVFSTDDFYVPLLGVLLKSICETKSAGNGYDLIVLHDELAPHRISSLFHITQGYANVSLRFVNVEKYVCNGPIYAANRSNLSKEAYFRLLIPDLFVRYEKMLYLDCDMIALRDVADLYNTGICENCIAAARDVYSFKTLLSPNEEEKAVGSNRIVQAHQSCRYFNSGMLLFNLTQIRKEFSAGHLWQTAISRPWKSHDQDVLNHVFFEKVHFLHARWNFCDVIFLDDVFPSFSKDIQTELLEAGTSPAIVHFLYPKRKPWEHVTHYAIAYFWPIAVRTPFYTELLQRQIKFVQKIRVIKSKKEAEDALKNLIPDEDRQSNIDRMTPYEISLSQQRLILQSMLQNKELEYRLQGKSEGYSRRRLALLAKTDGDPRKIERVTPQRVLSFEFSVCGHCNMRCKGCAHFAPLVKKDFADFEESDRAFARLGELFGGEAESVHLLGGEPLLHPQIVDFIKSVRKHFPIGKIEVVTNGLLLPKIGDSFWTAVRKNNIRISVTKYPIEFDYITAQALAAFYGVPFTYYGNSDLIDIKFFKLPLDISGEQDPDESFLNCYVANRCITLKNGRIFPCSIAPNMEYFTEEFGGIEFSPCDSLDIFAAKNKEEIVDFASLPSPLCRFCATKTRIPFEQWGTSKGEIEEWTV